MLKERGKVTRVLKGERNVEWMFKEKGRLEEEHRKKKRSRED